MNRKISHSYFVVMVDHGARGLEAVVKPEFTRRAIVDQLAHGEYQVVAFIHHVDGLLIEDVTLEILEEAEQLLRSEPEAIDHQAIRFDHARDLRKHQIA